MERCCCQLERAKLQLSDFRLNLAESLSRFLNPETESGLDSMPTGGHVNLASVTVADHAWPKTVLINRSG